MNSGEDKKPASQPLSEKKRSEFHLYGKPHHEKNLLGQQFEDRRYFDSGDLALSAAHQVANDGTVRTGTAHPMRETISHPYAPVPNTSNVSRDANKILHNERGPSPKMTESPLHKRSTVNEN